MQERQSGNDSGENGNSSDDFKNASDLHSDYRTGPISIRRVRIGKQFRKVRIRLCRGIEELGRKQSINWEGDFSFSPL
jgi:hypothetical protein